jgi:hypothetical protein
LNIKQKGKMETDNSVELKNSVTHSSVSEIVHFAVQKDGAAQLRRDIRRIGMVFKER